jgi:hypothetical protein
VTKCKSSGHGVADLVITLPLGGIRLPDGWSGICMTNDSFGHCIGCASFGVLQRDREAYIRIELLLDGAQGYQVENKLCLMSKRWL